MMMSMVMPQKRSGCAEKQLTGQHAVKPAEEPKPISTSGPGYALSIQTHYDLVIRRAATHSPTKPGFTSDMAQVHPTSALRHTYQVSCPKQGVCLSFHTGAELPPQL